ncbi:MAG: 23S rRNA (uracil(1939)-C(5))-methyltransferase RlmD [Anaerolineae bacterium]
MAETFELNLFGMAHGGEAIGRHEGRVIFVPYAIPGERIRAEVVEQHKRYARARLIEVLDPSPSRTEPPCPYFGQGKCGGCQLQHIDYAVQAQIKGLVVVDQMERVGKFEEPPVLEPLLDEKGWEYRSHSRYRTTPEGHPGFLASDSHRVVPIDFCLLSHPRQSELYQALDMTQPDVEQMELRVGTATGDMMVVLQTYDEEPPALEVDFPLSVVQVTHDTATSPLIGLDYITEIYHDREFRISATSFYQVNTAQAERLVEIVLGAADLTGSEGVLELYSGIGLFTAFLAPEAKQVTGIEVNPDAVDDALHNVGDADNVTFLEGLVEDALPAVDHTVDVALLDPPRGGVERHALDGLIAYHPARIVYVSCDPATLARDARRLVRSGYELAWVQPVDLFPQTYHIENVALFNRR